MDNMDNIEYETKDIQITSFTEGLKITFDMGGLIINNEDSIEKMLFMCYIHLIRKHGSFPFNSKFAKHIINNLGMNNNPEVDKLMEIGKIPLTDFNGLEFMNKMILDNADLDMFKNGIYKKEENNECNT